MWRNVGGKIKALAKVIFWIEVAFAVISYIYGLVRVFDSRYYVSSDYKVAYVFVGLLAVAVMVLLFWLGSFLLCGFGQLIESSEQTAYNTYRLLEMNGHVPPLNAGSYNPVPNGSNQQPQAMNGPNAAPWNNGNAPADNGRVSLEK